MNPVDPTDEIVVHADPTDTIPERDLDAIAVDAQLVGEPTPLPVPVQVFHRYVTVGWSASTGFFVRRAVHMPFARRRARAEARAMHPDATEDDLVRLDRWEDSAWWLRAAWVVVFAVAGIWTAAWYLGQIDAHGMWPLFLTVPVVLAALAALGAAVTGWRTLTGTSAPAPERDAPDAAPEQRRSLLRLIPGGRSDAPAPAPAPSAAPAPAPAPSAAPAPAPERHAPRTPARPAWLNRTEIEQRLLRAHRPLRNGEPLRYIPAPTPDAAPTPVRIELLDTEWMGNGWQITVELPADFTANKLVEQREEVARQWQVPPARILMYVGAAHPGVLVLWVADEDPLRSSAKWSNILDVTEVNLHRGYQIGEDIFGRPVRYLPIGTHCLTTGRSRSGKSVLQRLKLHFRLMDPHHENVIIDPQGGEWRAYRDVVRYFGGPDQMDDALAYLKHLVDVDMPRRANRLAELQELVPSQVTELKIPESLARDTTEQLHSITVKIEEATLLMMGERGAEWNDVLTKFSANGLKYLMQLDLTFQRISNRAMGGQGVELRDLAGETAFCGSVRSEAMATMALGDDWKKKGMNPLLIMPRVHAGTFVATGAALDLPEGVEHVMIKTAFTDDAEGVHVRRNALELRKRVRPGLLPDHVRPAGTTPERVETTPTAAPAAPPADPVDLEPLERVVSILHEHFDKTGETWMNATAVLTVLSGRWPVEHGDVTTTADLNRLLKQYGERTKQPTQNDGSRPHILRYPALRKKLHDLQEAQSDGGSGTRSDNT